MSIVRWTTRVALAVTALMSFPLSGLAVAAEPVPGQALGPVMVIAHRGASYDAPEHTFFAYDLAVQYDADFIECDLQITKDKVLVCMHDTTVDRTSESTGQVKDLTLAELRGMDFGTWYNTANPSRAKPAYAGAKVVPFEEQLGCYLGHNAKLRFHIETKAPSFYGGEMEPLLLAVLQRHGLVPSGPADPQTSPVIVQSFELDSLAAMKALAPSIPTAYLFTTPTQESVTGSYPDYVDAIGPNSALIAADPTLVQKAHQSGREVHTWTVDDPTQMDALLDLGVDGIFTNRADVLRAKVDARGSGVPAAVRNNPATFARGCPGVAGSVAAGPDPAVPEVPAAALVPLVAAATLGLVVIRRRRRQMCA
jgi:glycerophosphoryl diester phosphodiesterase